MESDSLAALIVPPSIIALLVIVFYALGVFDTLGGAPIARTQKAVSGVPPPASVPRAAQGGRSAGRGSKEIPVSGREPNAASSGSPVPEYRPPAANAPMRPGPRAAAMPPVSPPVVQDSNALGDGVNQVDGNELQQMPVVPEALPEQGATVQEEAVPDAEQAAAESADEQELQRQQELQDQQDQQQQQQTPQPQQQ
jgi:hypothetical protein